MATFLSQTQVDNIHQLYVSYFDRAADAAGADYWGDIYLAGVNAGKTDAKIMAELAATFAQTPEFNTTYPSTMSADAFVDKIYSNVLGRAADAAGKAYWVAQLNSGAVTKSEFIVAIVNAVESQAAGTTDVAYLANRVSVSEYFSETITSSTNAQQTSALQGVTSDPATVTAAEESISTLAGTTFTLTDGADEIVGTAANDKINGTDETLTVFDEINGGQGTDTLNLVFSDVATDVAGLSVTSVENIVIKAADAVGEEDRPFDMTGWVGVQNVTITASGAGAVEVASAAANAVSVAAKGVVTLTDETAASITVNTKDDDSEVEITAGDANVTVITTGEDADVVIAAADAGVVAVTVAESEVELTADSADSVSVTGATLVNVTVDDLGAVTLASAVDEGVEDDLTDDALVVIESTITTVDNTALALTLNGADVELEVIDTNAPDSTTDDDLTTLNLTVGAAALSNVLDLTSTTITDITVAGAGDLELTVETDTVTDIDASAATGDITVGIAGETMNYAGGAGVDTVTLTSLPIEALDEDDEGTGEFATTIDGGEGDADVLAMTAVIAAAAADIDGGDDVTDAIKGFEVLSLTAVDADEVDATLFGIDYVKLAGDADSFNLTIANEGTVEFTTAATDSTIIVDGAVDGDAEDFSLNLVLTGGEDGINATAVAVANVGELTLASNGTEVEVDDEMVVTAENAVALTAAAVTTLTITGNAALALTGSDLVAIETVDAADFDADLTIDVSSSDAEDGVSITVGDGNNNIVGSAQDDTIVVGKGDNEITGAAGADAITLGTGVNTLVYATASESTGLTVDTVTGFNANDLDADEDDEAFNTFDLDALLADVGAGNGAVTFLGSVANATLANTALVDVVADVVAADDLQVIYVTGEKTLYADANGNGTIDAGDLAIELVGLVGTLTQDNFGVA